MIACRTVARFDGNWPVLDRDRSSAAAAHTTAQSSADASKMGPQLAKPTGYRASDERPEPAGRRLLSECRSAGGEISQSTIPTDGIAAVVTASSVVYQIDGSPIMTGRRAVAATHDAARGTASVGADQFQVCDCSDNERRGGAAEQSGVQRKCAVAAAESSNREAGIEAGGSGIKLRQPVEQRAQSVSPEAYAGGRIRQAEPVSADAR